MNPYYFGDSSRPLFGIYDPPVSKRVQDAIIVLCYPIAQEYIRAHWAFRRLATLLSSEGFHVFRFDYYATGDSAGESHEGTIEQWKADIGAAVDELKDTSGLSEVWLVGLRFGATLAMLTSMQRSDIKGVVLWDPIVNGKGYIATLKEIHERLLTFPWWFPIPRSRPGNVNFDELVGFPFPPAMRSDIEQVDVLCLSLLPALKILLVVSEDKAEYRYLREHLRMPDVKLDYHLIPGAGDWEELDKLQTALIPNEILQTITSVLSEQQT